VKLQGPIINVPLSVDRGGVRDRVDLVRVYVSQPKRVLETREHRHNTVHSMWHALSLVKVVGVPWQLSPSTYIVLGCDTSELGHMSKVRIDILAN
jgi:hypothetical protein